MDIWTLKSTDKRGCTRIRQADPFGSARTGQPACLTRTNPRLAEGAIRALSAFIRVTLFDSRGSPRTSWRHPSGFRTHWPVMTRILEVQLLRNRHRGPGRRSSFIHSRSAQGTPCTAKDPVARSGILGRSWRLFPRRLTPSSSRWPRRAFPKGRHPPEDGGRLPYDDLREVYRQARGTALALVGLRSAAARAGGAGVRDRPEWVTAYLGILLAGCTAVPLDAQLSPPNGDA